MRRIFLLCLVFASAASATELTPHAAEYRVKMSGLSGVLETRLEKRDGVYDAHHSIRATGIARVFAKGSISERARFESTEDGVSPLHYASVDELTKDETRADVVFDWSNEAISGEVNGAAVQQDIDAGVFDRISIQYQLMRNLLDDREETEYTLFDIDEFKALEISRLDAEEIKTPAGTFTAIGISHQAKNSSRVTTLWCVEELDYLPVLIEQHKNGKRRLRAELKKYETLLAEAD